MIDTLWAILTAILHASCQAALVALLVAGIQLSLGRRLSPNWRIALWLLVMIRLIAPALPASRFSLLNLLQPASPSLAAPLADPQPTITFGIIDDSPTPVSHPPTHVPTPVSHAWDWQLLTLACWALGTLALLARLAISQVILLHRLRSSHLIEDTHVNRLIDESRRSLRAPPIKCVEADWITAPALCGLFHHTLLLPRDFPNTLSDSDLRFILMHELIHARRRDLLVDRLIAFIVAIHWFNPAAWLSWRRIRIERELACDQAVIRSISSEDRLNYGNTLLKIFETFSARPNVILSVGVIGRGSSLRGRLLAIVHPPRHWKLQSAIALLCMAIIACAAFTSAEPSPTSAIATQPTTPSGMVIRNYDVHPLLISIPDFDDAPDFNLIPQPASAPSKPSKPRPTTQQVAQTLIAEIQSHIDPPSWKSASISESNGQLTITQTPTNQDAIWQYFSARIVERTTLITVETRLMHLTPAIISRWKSLHPKQLLDGESFSFTKADCDELIQLCKQDQSASSIIAPRLTLFNGQRAYILVATTRAYVRDLHPKPSTTHPSEPDYEPDVSTAQSGVLLDVRAKVSADRQYVTLDLNDQLSNLLAMNTLPWPHAPRGRKDLTIQVPTMRVQQLNLSVSLPNDGYFASPAVESIEPAGAIPASKAPTLVIIHATINSSDHPPTSVLTTRPSDLMKFLRPQP